MTDDHQGARGDARKRNAQGVPGVTLTHDEHLDLGRALIEALRTKESAHVREAVERIIAARVQQAEAERDTHRETAETMSGMWQVERERADRLEAMCDRLAGDRVDREDRAEARYAALVAKVEALANEWDAEDFRIGQHASCFAESVTRLRALLGTED